MQNYIKGLGFVTVNKVKIWVRNRITKPQYRSYKTPQIICERQNFHWAFLLIQDKTQNENLLVLIQMTPGQVWKHDRASVGLWTH